MPTKHALLNNQLDSNISIFKSSLERIIEKYSQLRDNDGIEVDVHNVSMKAYLQCLHGSKEELSELELSESSTNSSKQTSSVQDITGDTQQLDASDQDVGEEESGFRSDHSTVEQDAVSEIDSTQLDQSSIDETRSLLETSQPEDHDELDGTLSSQGRSFVTPQPEDHDEELERTLSSHGSSFMTPQPEDDDEELERTLSSHGRPFMEQCYPRVILKIGEAWHRQYVSKAADSVLRRYRRLRGNFARGGLNRTFNVTSRSTDGNPKNVKNTKSVRQRSPNTSLTMGSLTSNKRAKPAFQSPACPTFANLPDWQAEGRSPRKVDVSVKREFNRSVQVMDFSVSGISPEPEEAPLNRFFTVSQLSSFSSQEREQPTPLFFSPPKSRTAPAGAYTRPSLRPVALAPLPLRRSIIPSDHPVYGMETSSVTESTAVLRSPARQSPFKTRLTGQGGSPHVLSRSPKAGFVERYPRDKEPRSGSAAASFSLQTSVSSPGKLRPQESYSPSQLNLSSPQSSTGVSTRPSLRPVALAPLPLRRFIIPSDHPVYGMETSSVTESAAVLRSPARQSPFKTRLTGQGGSPHVLSRSPKAGFVERYPRDKEPRSVSAAASFSLQTSVSSPGKLRPQESYSPSQLNLSSPQSSTGVSTRPSLRPVALAPLPLRRSIIPSDHPVYGMETSSVTESAAVLRSPARQSPFKTRLTGQGGSPRVLSRSPKAGFVERYPRDKEPRSVSAAASFSLQTSIASPGKLRPQESYSPSQLNLSSPQSSTGAGRRRLRRHFSLDSSFQARNALHRMKIDGEFQEYYHQFVCQGKSAPSNAPPCRLCVRNSEASRGHTSSALEALALSPHHSGQRKRTRESDRNMSPKSKRCRDWDSAYSPGSLRYRRDVLSHQHPHSSRNLFSKENLAHSPRTSAVPQPLRSWWPSSKSPVKMDGPSPAHIRIL